MKRYLAAAGVGTLVFGAVLGSASALNIDEGAVAQYGQTAELTCDENVTVASYGVEADTPPAVSHNVRITEISAACEGHDLFATVSDSSGNVIGTGFAQITSTQATVTWEGGPVSVREIERLGLTIE